MKPLSLLVAMNVAALIVSPALAQQKTLYVAGYGGSYEKTIREEVIPAFEQANGIKVEYVAGNSTDTLAKLQAQKGNQQIDVAIVDDGPMYQAIQLGFCGKVDGLSADLYDAARFKDDRAVGTGLVATGLMYNTKVFAEKGWAPPTSWNDLRDPKYQKQVVIPPINSPGVMSVNPVHCLQKPIGRRVAYLRVALELLRTIRQVKASPVGLGSSLDARRPR